MTKKGLERTGEAGGAATTGGVSFEGRISAYFAASLLAGDNAPPPMRLPAGTRLKAIHCQFNSPIDDIVLQTSSDGFVFIQAKRRIPTLSKKNFDDVIDQFVRQLVAMDRPKKEGMHPWQRPLDPDHDRVVLATSSEKLSGNIRANLQNLWDRFASSIAATTFLDVAKNDDEKTIARRIDAQIKTTWNKVLGVDPKTADLRRLTKCMWLEVLDLEDGQHNRLAAGSILRQNVLLDGDQENFAWSTLTLGSTKAHRNRESISIDSIRSLFARDGIKLGVSSDYRSDIDRLRNATTQTLSATRSLSVLKQADQSEFVLKRSEARPLAQAAREGNLLVVGSPGCGKSGVLHHFVTGTRENGGDVVFLALDEYPVDSNHDLRESLGIDHDILEVLRNWPGTDTGYVVIDALDAVRDPKSKAFWHRLVREVAGIGGRWKLVASIREFDLRYSDIWRDQFHGTPVPDFNRAEFSDVRHVEIGDLTDENIGNLGVAYPKLGEVLASSTRLAGLLRNLFNMRLAVELIADSGFGANDFSTVKHQAGLLDAYWRERVEKPLNDQVDRENALSAFVGVLVAKRRLFADQSELSGIDRKHIEAPNIVSRADGTNGPISTTWRFKHHIIFDYAAARLWLGLSLPPTQVVGKIQSDRDLALFLAQSLHLLFEDAWAHLDDNGSGNSKFWDLAQAFSGADTLPEIARLHAATVIADNANNIQELEPLLEIVSSEADSGGIRQDTNNLLRHLAGALAHKVVDQQWRLCGTTESPWPSFAHRLAEVRDPKLQYAQRILIWKLVEEFDQASDSQKSDIGLASRKVLENARSYEGTEYHDATTSRVALESVCQTISTDVEASSNLISFCLSNARLESIGYLEAPEISRFIKKIAAVGPELAVEIYKAFFGYTEDSSDPTNMGSGSQILPLTSNRKQDFDISKWHLVEAFTPIADQNFKLGVEIVVAAIDAAISASKDEDVGIEKQSEIPVGGKKAKFRLDRSYLWAPFESRRDYDDRSKLVSRFREFLRALAGSDNAPKKIQQAVDLCVRKNRNAVVWACLIDVAADYPGSFDARIVEIITAPQVLKSLETHFPVGRFFENAFPTLTTAQRRSIEDSLVNLSSVDGYIDKAEGFIGLLKESSLLTDACKATRARIREQGKERPNRPPYKTEVRWSSRKPSPLEFFQDRGVDPNAPENAKWVGLIDRLSAARNEVPEDGATIDDFAKVESLISESVDLINRTVGTSEENPLVPGVEDNLADLIARFCSSWECATDCKCRSVLKEALRLTACGANPEPSEESNRSFETSVGWGVPNARIETAQGLMDLRFYKKDDVGDFTDILNTLSLDSDAAVRFQIARNIIRGKSDDDEWADQKLHDFATSDPNGGVAAGLVDCIERISFNQPERVFQLAKAIADRFRDRAEDEDPPTCYNNAVDLISDLYIRNNLAQSKRYIDSLIANVLENSIVLQSLGRRYREALVINDPQPTAEVGIGMRRRAVNLFRQLINETLSAIEPQKQRYENQRREEKEPDKDITTKLRNGFQLVDSLMTEIYFASGAYDREKTGEPPTKEQERLFEEAYDLLETLSDHGVVHTSHYLVETLEGYIPYKPAEVFDLIARAIKSAAKHGYGHESLALGVVVRIVERYIADHRGVFDTMDRRNALLSILDVFVEAGWPEARRMVYRVGEIW